MNEDKFPAFTYFVKNYIPMEKKCSKLMITFKFEKKYVDGTKKGGFKIKRN